MSNQCPGLRSLYHAAKLRQLRAIAADPNTAPARVKEVTLEITKLAEPLYIGPEAGPSALIARLEREGIEAVERRTAEVWDAACRNLVEPRPSVMDFARRMEATLRRHDAKKGGQKEWRKIAPHELIDRLFDEANEAFAAWNSDGPASDPRARARTAAELIDVANFAMMGHDVLVPLADDEAERTLAGRTDAPAGGGA